MATVTAHEIENNDKKYFLFGIKVTVIIMIIMAVVALLPGAKEIVVNGEISEAVKFMGITADPIYFWRTLGIAGLFVLIIYVIVKRDPDAHILYRNILHMLIPGIVVLNVLYINDVSGIDPKPTNNYAFLSLDKPEINDDSFYRIDGQQYNANLIWNISSIDNFVTDSAASLIDFYSEFEIKRTQAAFIDSRYYPLYSLLSCKYYLNQASGDDLNVEILPIKIEGFDKKDIQPYYHIYENKAYVPVGFSYDYYITESAINQFIKQYVEEHPQIKTEEDRDENIDGKDAMSLMLANWAGPVKYNFSEKYLQKMLVMLRAIVIPDEDESKVSGMLLPLPDTMLENLGTETYYADCADRKSESCSDFSFTKTGFEAKISSDKQNLVYFSVPIMDGWSAEVNGKEAEIVKVNYGFMAVKVDEGDNEIVFNYENKNFKTGAVISLVGLAMFICYMIVCKFIDRNNSKSGVKVVDLPVQESNGSDT